MSEQTEKERKKFEASCKEKPNWVQNPIVFARRENGRYQNLQVHFMWEGWLARSREAEAQLARVISILEDNTVVPTSSGFLAAIREVQKAMGGKG